MANLNTAIPYIKKAEGGLSRALTDSASSNPAPWAYNGKTGYHTNKGITYTTFSSLASKLGYSNTPDNFFKMPDSIWLKIYKNGYWDAMQADTIISEPIAVAVVDYAWAFGVGGAQSRLKKWLLSEFKIIAYTSSDIANSLNKLISAKGEPVIFNQLVNHRKAAFIALKQPANEPGWISRMEELRNFGQSLFGKIVSSAKNNAGALGLVFFLVCS